MKSFAVGPDQTLTYPHSSSGANQLAGFADEHTTFFPPAAAGDPYLVFGAAATSATATGVWGAVVLQTTDLKTFDFATGYSFPVLAAPMPFSQCNPSDNSEFDENYAAPGSVLQDPTLPPGNLIMLYEAENHCPGGVHQGPFYATVGFARSSDNGKTWPAPQNGALGGPTRFPVIQSPEPQPSVPHGYVGDAIPSGFVDKSASGDYYLYVAYAYFSTSGESVRVARAKLGADPLTFMKWYNGSFSQPGIGGLDSAVTASTGCGSRQQTGAEISYNDDLGLYFLIAKCYSGTAGALVGGWYYSTATSLDLEDWTEPQLIQNSQYPLTSPCPGQTSGQDFDGYYLATMSPGAAPGHTKLTGYFFFSHVTCELESRLFLSRTFTITTEPEPQINSAGIVIHAGNSGTVAPGSLVDIYGTNLAAAAMLAGSGDLPTMLGGVQVLVNGTAAPLIYVSPLQIIFQMPYETALGTASVVVALNGAASAAVPVKVQQSAPFILTYGSNRAVAFNPDGSLNASGNGAKPSDVMVAYLMGSGPLDNPIASGAPASSSPLSRETLPTSVSVGGASASVQFAGMAPGYVGLMQVNFVMPNLASGDYPMQVSIGTAASNQPLVTVSK
ncbi:MAG TPA: IPT/TIG domain-containing protein [Bryobacteraceae bacterium]|nr:IPT/TIG domain-containing protein [Bryobacteraceae bacterium]